MIGIVTLAGTLHSLRHTNSHEVQRPRELVTDVDHAGGPPPAHIIAFLVQDRRSTGMEVVEGIERLGQPEAYFASTENSSVAMTCSTISSSRAASSTSDQSSCAVVTGQLTGGQPVPAWKQVPLRETITFLELAEDVVDTDDGVLDADRSRPES